MSIELLRELPSVDEIINSEELCQVLENFPRPLILKVVREEIESLRDAIKSDENKGKASEQVTATTPATIITTVVIKRLESLLAPSMVRMINATGTLLHTNLGRAALADEAISAVKEAATYPQNLEYNLKDGKRGERDSHVEELIKALTGAEAACVVNNNAAAVLITLNTLADKRDVVISRGELIEIGGSFRLPDIIEKSGCNLKEIGTTNRTHPEDYKKAISEKTALLFKAHTSNYLVVGFTSGVGLKELSKIGTASGLPVVEDLGSGSLIDLSRFGLDKDPLVSESIRDGVDVVTFSGDKLLGGPQSGIIAGKKKYIDMIRKNPLKRALRADKLALAALSATLRLYLNPLTLKEKLPTLRVLLREISEIEGVAKQGRELLQKKLGRAYEIKIIDGLSQLGSGALPTSVIPTKLITIKHEKIKPEKIFKTFLASTPPVLGRVQNESFILDMRTIEDATSICPS
ncbi:MAG: L-seryl-tRNA(Sec) selenium transferase [Deltaproteobacteria bacterium]|nr:L-seryl-tRNA(Sec) selenium transferase [Deltaproteobacteria bacterium]